MKSTIIPPKQLLKKYFLNYLQGKATNYPYKKIYSRKLIKMAEHQQKFLNSFEDDLKNNFLIQNNKIYKRQITINGKNRNVFFYPPSLDFLCYLINIFINSRSSEIYNPNLFSYRTGIGKLDAIKSFAKYVRNNYSKKSDLFVLRSDVKSYGASIDVSPSSILWKQLKQLTQKISLDKISTHNFIKLSQPTVINENGHEYCPLFGIIDGTSIACILLNIYLEPIDEELSKIEGAFYARYGDDIIFSHTNAHLTKEAQEKISLIFDKLKLQPNINKSGNYYLNSAGKIAQNNKDFKPSQNIEYLGISINSKGEIEIRKDKLKQIYSDIKLKLNTIRNITTKENYLELSQNLIREYFDSRSQFCCKYIEELKLITCPSQIADINYKIRFMILQKLLRKNSAKNFKVISPKTLIKKYGFRSFKYYIGE